MSGESGMFFKSASFQLNTIWIMCDGVYPADKEYIGPIKYYPFQGFPSYFYPYNGQDDYLSPLVAVHLERPTRKLWFFLNQM